MRPYNYKTRPNPKQDMLDLLRRLPFRQATITLISKELGMAPGYVSAFASDLNKDGKVTKMRNGRDVVIRIA